VEYDRSGEYLATGSRNGQVNVYCKNSIGRPVSNDILFFFFGNALKLKNILIYMYSSKTKSIDDRILPKYIKHTLHTHLFKVIQLNLIIWKAWKLKKKLIKSSGVDHQIMLCICYQQMIKQSSYGRCTIETSVNLCVGMGGMEVNLFHFQHQMSEILSLLQLRKKFTLMPIRIISIQLPWTAMGKRFCLLMICELICGVLEFRIKVSVRSILNLCVFCFLTYLFDNSCA